MENIRDTVEQLLRSPQLRESLETTVRNLNMSRAQVAQSGTPQSPRVGPVTAPPSTSIRTELNNLFPSIRPRGGTSRTLQRRRIGGQSTTNKLFYKDVILVPYKNCLSTLKGVEKAKAYEHKFAFSDVQFSTEMNSQMIYDCIKSIFGDKLLNYNFELVVPRNGRLIPINLTNGTELTGAVVKRAFTQKVIYIRPTEDDVIGYAYRDLSQENLNNNVENLVESYNIDDDLAGSSHLSTPTNMDIDSDIIVVSTEVDGPDTLLRDILQTLQNKISKESVSYFNVFREEIFLCCLRAMRRPLFNPFDRIDVNFTDIDGKIEGALDMGGPSRELFRLILRYLESSYLFMGTEKKYVSLDAIAFDKKYYFEAGRLISLSIVHHGIGPHFFSNSLYSAITQGIEKTVALMEYVELDIQEKLTEFSLIEDENELNNFILDDNIFSIAGINMKITMDKKNEIFNAAVKFYHLYRTKPALDQFMNGLETCGILELIQSHPSLFQEMMCENTLTLNVKILDEIFLLKHCESGSNLRQKENRIACYWKDYLMDCQDGAAERSLKDVLIFTTGCEAIPALNFPKKIDIIFNHGCNMKYPTANTCGLELYLPTCYTDYEDFKNQMDFAIGNSKDFGLI